MYKHRKTSIRSRILAIVRRTPNICKDIVVRLPVSCRRSHKHQAMLHASEHDNAVLACWVLVSSDASEVFMFLHAAIQIFLALSSCSAPSLMSSGASSSTDAPHLRDRPSRLEAPRSDVGECIKCGRAGCTPESSQCPYHGRERDSHPDAGWGDNVPHISELDWHTEGSDIRIEGALFVRGKATTVQNNCLIDSLRQTLGVVANEKWVRSRLQVQFPHGPECVTSSNFLTLEYHWHAVVNALFVADQSRRPKLDSHSFRVVCVDLTWEGNGDVLGAGPKTLYIAREGQCHFIPLFRKQLPSEARRNRRAASSKESGPPSRDRPSRLGARGVPKAKPPHPRAPTAGSAGPTRDMQQGSRREKSHDSTLPASAPSKDAPAGLSHGQPRLSWSVSDVAEWARATFDNGFAETLAENDIDGAALLSLTGAELEEDLSGDRPQRRATILKLIDDPGSTQPGARANAERGAASDPHQGASDPRRRSGDDGAEANATAGDTANVDGSKQSEATSPKDTPDKNSGDAPPPPPPAAEDLSSIPYFIPRAMPAIASPDPRRQAEECLSDLAAHLRHYPTLPDTGVTDDTLTHALSPEMALQLPPKHCAFRGCGWAGNTDQELLHHLKTHHAPALEGVLEHKTEQATEDEQAWAAYNHAVGHVCQQSAPTATYSIDRRALRSYQQAVSGDNVQELICFCCARRFPHTASCGAKQLIRWRPAQPSTENTSQANDAPLSHFFGLPYEEAQRLLGLQTYLDRYGKCGDDEPDLTQQLHEFDDWTVDVPFDRGVLTLLCCPEDRRCTRCHSEDATRVCRACEFPLCNDCARHLDTDEPRMPPAALTNDMMIFYAPRDIYQDKVTCMELLCASACITTMIFFTLEAKYRKENPFDQEVHMARHRMGARGNVTTFLLPWQDLLKKLEAATESVPDLPRTGDDLGDLVSVVLKTNEESSPDNMARFVHQANVRRRVVIKLIHDAKARGQRGYRKLDMATVERKVERLPENGIPPEIVNLLPHDKRLDNIMVQKAACPVSGRGWG